MSKKTQNNGAAVIEQTMDKQEALMTLRQQDQLQNHNHLKDQQHQARLEILILNCLKDLEIK